MLRFGKSVLDIIEIKKNYFTDNDRLRDEQLCINQLYAAQPQRRLCKLCAVFLKNSFDFVSHGVEYLFCSNCGHLNGRYEDTEQFCRAVYAEDDGRNYAKTYHSADRDAYFKRVKQIYAPKADFLWAAIDEQGYDPRAFKYVELGAGSGYFVAALRGKGVNAVGYEVSRSQVELAAQMLEGPFVTHHEMNELNKLIDELDADVVTMIGVLEHVQRPRDVLDRLKRNPKIKYLYYAVPMFSPSVFVEMAFPKVMPRHLIAGHTHLFTEQSLRWMEREWQMARVAEWWFGTDVMDLFRSIAVTLEKSESMSGAVDHWRETLMPVLDDLQMVFDRRKMSSEIHALSKLMV